MTARPRQVWLFALAVGVVVLHLPYLWPGGPWARLPEPLKLGQDEGTVLYDSLRILRGEVMFRDFFEFQGPVFYYLHALLFWITGPSILAARVVHVLVTATGSGLLAMLVARRAGRVAGAGAAAIHAFILLPMWPFAYPHWLAEALVLGGLVLATREEKRPRDEILAGACFGLAAMTIQSVGVPVLLAVLVVAAVQGLARAGRLAAGAAAALLPIALYFAAHGALGALGWSMFRWSLTHYKLGQGPAVTYAWFVGPAMQAHHVLAQPWRFLSVLGLGVTYVLPFFAVAAGVVYAALGAYGIVRRRREGFDAVLLAGVAVAGVSSLWLAPVRPDLTHVAYLGSFGLVGLGLLVALVPARARRWTAPVVAAVGVLMLFTYVQKIAWTWKPSRAMGDWRQESLKLPSAAEIDRTVAPDAKIVVGAMGGFYYLYVRPSAVPNTYIPATFADYLAESQWRAIADSIADQKPEALLFVGRQWTEILKRRPELEARYAPQSGFLRLKPDHS